MATFWMEDFSRLMSSKEEESELINKLKEVKPKVSIGCSVYNIEEFWMEKSERDLRDEQEGLYYSITNEEPLDYDSCCVCITNSNWTHYEYDSIIDSYGISSHTFYLNKNGTLYKLSRISHPVLGFVCIASDEPCTNEEHIRAFKEKLEKLEEELDFILSKEEGPILVKREREYK